MQNGSFILKGHICHTPEAGSLVIRENAYTVCEDGICRGIFGEIPEKFRGLEVIDCGDRMILPGMADLHIHAPQFAYRGTGMDHELLEWLQQNAFPEEIRFSVSVAAVNIYVGFEFGEHLLNLKPGIPEINVKPGFRDQLVMIEYILILQ